MLSQPPDQATSEKRITLGRCADGDAQVSEMLSSLKTNDFVCNIQPFPDCEWLRELTWPDA